MHNPGGLQQCRLIYSSTTRFIYKYCFILSIAPTSTLQYLQRARCSSLRTSVRAAIGVMRARTCIPQYIESPTATLSVCFSEGFSFRFFYECSAVQYCIVLYCVVFEGGTGATILAAARTYLGQQQYRLYHREN